MIYTSETVLLNWVYWSSYVSNDSTSNRLLEKHLIPAASCSSTVCSCLIDKLVFKFRTPKFEGLIFLISDICLYSSWVVFFFMMNPWYPTGCYRRDLWCWENLASIQREWIRVNLVMFELNPRWAHRASLSATYRAWLKCLPGCCERAESRKCMNQVAWLISIRLR